MRTNSDPGRSLVNAAKKDRKRRKAGDENGVEHQPSVADVFGAGSVDQDGMELGRDFPPLSDSQFEALAITSHDAHARSFALDNPADAAELDALLTDMYAGRIKVAVREHTHVRQDDGTLRYYMLLIWDRPKKDLKPDDKQNRE